MEPLSRDDRRRLARLGPALTARKNADAADFAAAQAAVDAIDAEINKIASKLAVSASQLDASDLTERVAFERWRAAQKQRFRELAAQRLTALKALEQRREALTRSNGEVEALKRLLGDDA
ncbi:MAG: hypothetical protein MRY74_17115 [Neomegalonema sp.]|nr:hypothetical protein [Neomegalonema sp.]